MNKQQLLAPAPPMGWNSWNTFGAKVDEEVLRSTADAFIETGLKDAGYKYVVFNRSDGEADIAFTWPEVGLPAYLSLKVRDLWAHEDQGSFEGSYSARVPSHGVVLLSVR